MKTFHFPILLMLKLMFWNVPCIAQNAGVKAKQSFVEPYQLQITTNKTTNLIFPSTIKSVDRGSADLLAQEAKGIDNILQVKAAKEGFTETNLTVITSDGNLYSFIVNFEHVPSKLTISFPLDTLLLANVPVLKAAVDVKEENLTEASIINTADRLLKKRKRNIHSVKDRSYKMKLRLTMIYVQRDVMYYQLECRNKSNIDYDVDMLRFYLRDEKRSKRTATQELEIKPITIAGNTSQVKGKSRITCMVALPKFTIPDAKYLAIEMKEANGGRNLLLKVHNRHIIHASVI